MKPPKPPNRFDRVSDDELENQAFKVLLETFQHVRPLGERIESLTVGEGTSMYGDDLATPYQPISTQFVNLASVAQDHLRGVSEGIQSNHSVTAMSNFTLVRAAIEATGNALWLVGPTSRDERVIRSLRLTWSNRTDLHNLIVELGGDDVKYERVRSRLAGIKDLRPGLATRSFTTIESVTKRMRYAGTLLPPDDFLPDLTLIALWRTASGIVHGNQSVMLNVLDHEVISDTVAGVASHRMTTSISLFTAYYRKAMTSLAHAILLFDQRNRS